MSDPLNPRRRSKIPRAEEEPLAPSTTRSSATTSQDETTSPPAKGRRLDSSPGGDLEPLPLSPQSGGVGADRSLFSSPPQSRLGAPTSEIDPSSPQSSAEHQNLPRRCVTLTVRNGYVIAGADG
uniref:Uncharacterized protein LOC111137708 n=1 Tax=Crassostrea virginica TaxID=6565 RepID=A0A8B8EYE7_CRAVI|nr:uncharacterized protein LOC111137708 [Crassostrea virginica]XP_022345019.1 uncharacterized protein LOC111137708 [Crassostrea virginica]XP_022345020.1 uncharacterized protein LOC111137708 [Crassostrea virginica]